MQDLMISKLKAIEIEHNIKVIYALISGSRARNTISEGSDYDIRFVYTHPLDWYLTIGDKKDTIIYPTRNIIDIGGWDIRKTLFLLYKGNPTLLEWLYSKSIYYYQIEIIDNLKILANNYFNEKKFLYYYLNLAKKNYISMEKRSEFNNKHYLYILHSLLSCIYIENYHMFPPISLNDLLMLVTDKNILNEINLMVQNRKTIVNTSLLNNYLISEINHFDKYIKSLPNILFDINPLNQYLIQLLHQLEPKIESRH